MPLYIDFHQYERISAEEVTKAHMADVAVQDRYGVRYIQFWVNEQAGTVFCLVEGPNSVACEECHMTAHGSSACNLQEVKKGFLKLFMGDGQPNNQGLTLTKEGKIDPANRTILVVDIRSVLAIEEVQHRSKLFKLKSRVIDALTAFDGRFVEHSVEDSLIGVFNSPLNAIRCALNIQTELSRITGKYRKNRKRNVEYRISVNNGQPLTEKEGFFEVAIKQAKRLCAIADPNQIILSSNLQSLYEIEMETSKSSTLSLSARILTKPEEDFLCVLFDHIEPNLQTESFNVNSLCRLMGTSRPQLYRKTIALTGKSPNRFIKDLRMQKAWQLLKTRKGNISEVALEVGYSNPSYFSKLFYESFGDTPSSLAISRA